jgi:hypothetical protein
MRLCILVLIVSKGYPNKTVVIPNTAPEMKLWWDFFSDILKIKTKSFKIFFIFGNKIYLLLVNFKKGMIMVENNYS